jgi:hypothetical protein
MTHKAPALTRAEMATRGAAHAAAGQPLTPFACQVLDRELLDAARLQERPAKWYATMRGAFNRGWEAEYFRRTEVEGR